ncbi:hypothetical protein L9F63_015930 [Diploptera punctata]|uniref:Uncharacterized protein n=1 Tax=Diploptera punctata TaxID=6984 RepID=A0AAD8A5A7_DIPPU|nr:hypothetical protein L9F63_015930 [Diploptera punctata]
MLVVVILLITSSVDSTWNDAEGGNIPVPQDTLSWPQIGLVKTVFLLLVILWFYGMLPIMVPVHLNRLVEGRSLMEDSVDMKCKMLCQLMAYVTEESTYEAKSV